MEKEIEQLQTKLYQTYLDKAKKNNFTPISAEEFRNRFYLNAMQYKEVPTILA